MVKLTGGRTPYGHALGVIMQPGQRVGILTERTNLTARHFAGAGWPADEIPIHVGALAADAVFPAILIDGFSDEADSDVLEAEIVDAAVRLTPENPDIGALVLEVTNFVPYSSQAIRDATGLPVFDLYTLVMQVYEATTSRGPVCRCASRGSQTIRWR